MKNSESNDYNVIAKHYLQCFREFGDNHKGVDWPNLEGANKRYSVMMAGIPSNSGSTILDFGCGLGHMLDYINNESENNIDYTGVDINDEFVELCKVKFPDRVFLSGDILEGKLEGLKDSYDYIISNGVFTHKSELSFDNMWDYTKSVIRELWKITGRHLIINFMSKNVDWERDDCFHLPMDTLADFLCKEITRDFILRNDYQLYEYAVIIYK